MRCQRLAACTLAMLLLSFSLFSAGLVPAPTHWVAAETALLALWWLPFALWLASLVAFLLPGGYPRCSDDLDLRFDGREWFSTAGVPARVEASYLSANLLAARVVVGGRRHQLLLARGQVSREGWRRIRLGLRATVAPTGES